MATQPPCACMGLCTIDTLKYTLKITHTSVIRKADAQVHVHTHTHTHTLLKYAKKKNHMQTLISQAHNPKTTHVHKNVYLEVQAGRHRNTELQKYIYIQVDIHP